MNKTIDEIFGSLVFNDQVMKKRLSKDAYMSLNKTMTQGKALNRKYADEIASAMKDWAIENGCTHYTHWFQPLTGTTSEKHDSFISPLNNGCAITKFTAENLLQGEPDASSFPSGGLRRSSHARGYTAWDPTSYAFIKDEVLCIPSVFISFDGSALDKKTPLIRSMKALSEQGLRVLHCIGIRDVEQIDTKVGAEQEYFLIPLELYSQRRDLILCGRTLFGCAPEKGQELDEHYYGAVRENVNEFMKEVDIELWKLGVEVKTKHNEVAPAQHEIAPIFCGTTKAVDNNLLTMEILRKVAPHHGFFCLINDKPFSGVNGSGKHNNWSIFAGDKNMLDPGKDPANNLVFLLSLAAVIKAVDDYKDLLRFSVASHHTDMRLGADEAPPTQLSIFLGEQLTALIDAIIKGKHTNVTKDKILDLGVDVLPNLKLDGEDRNRTSPFAFVGNRFEFRMPGATCNLSTPNTVLNTAVAKSFRDFADQLEGLSVKDAKIAAFDICKETFKKHKGIIFNDDCYKEEQSCVRCKGACASSQFTGQAIEAADKKKNIDLLTSLSIVTYDEAKARFSVVKDFYAKKINVEIKTMLNMIRELYMPAILKYEKLLCELINSKMEIASKATSKSPKICSDVEIKVLVRLQSHIQEIYASMERLEKSAKSVRKAIKCGTSFDDDLVNKYMSELRAEIDAVENLVPKDYWPVPSYVDMLFYV
ncbi:MAG: glutamine synthetase III [Coriobacteriales bacterium]|nr:glutamine synthetase III [Coriobacteriales bacterium]